MRLGHGEGAAAGEHEHELPGVLAQLEQEFPLAGRQFDRGAVAARRGGDGVALLALERVVEAEDGDDDLGRLGGREGVVDAGRGRLVKRAARAVLDLRALDGALDDALEQRDQLRADAVVVAEEHVAAGGVRPDDEQAGRIAAEREDAARVFEQHDRLGGRPAREGAMRGAVDDRGRGRGPRDALGRVEQAEAEAGGQQAAQRGVDLRLGDEAVASPRQHQLV